MAFQEVKSAIKMCGDWGVLYKVDGMKMCCWVDVEGKEVVHYTYDIEGEMIDTDPVSFVRDLQSMSRERRRAEVMHNIGMPENYSVGGEGDVCVSVYVVTRHWGGAEEGGWWWNRVELVRSVPTECDEECLRKVALRLRDWAIMKELKWGDIYSVNGGQDCYVVIESEMGEGEELKKPRYE